jgi:peroxiredoxin
MKSILAAVVVLGLFGFARPLAADTGPQALELGHAAPLHDVKMKSVDGHELSIAEAAGKKGTLVVFMCNHCPWVKAWQTRIAAIGNQAVGLGIGVIAINSNDPAAYPEDSFDQMKARSAQLGFHFPYAVDATSDIARAFGATRTPEAFLFDASGKLIYHGTVDDNAQDESAVKQTWLKDAVQAAAAGKPVHSAETKAFGCGIKFRDKTSS